MPAYIHINGNDYQLETDEAPDQSVDELRSAVGADDAPVVPLRVVIGDRPTTLLVAPAKVVTFATYERQ